MLRKEREGEREREREEENRRLDLSHAYIEKLATHNRYRPIF